MVIRIQKNSIKFNQLVDYLAKQFPNYNFWQIGSNTLKIEKDKLISAYITVRKNKIIIRVGFTHFKQYVIAALLFVGLGFIFPLIVYFAVLYPKIRKFAQKLADEIYSYYKQVVLNYATFGNMEAK